MMYSRQQLRGPAEHIHSRRDEYILASLGEREPVENKLLSGRKRRKPQKFQEFVEGIFCRQQDILTSLGGV